MPQGLNGIKLDLNEYASIFRFFLGITFMNLRDPDILAAIY